MKTFVSAMCILLALILLIGLNTRYVSSVTDRMMGEIAALPRADEEGCADALSALASSWEQSHRLIGLSVNAHIVEQIGNQIASLTVNCQEQATEDFEVNRELLLHTVRQLREFERCSIWNIV